MKENKKKREKNILYLFSRVRVRISVEGWKFSEENVYVPLTL